MSDKKDAPPPLQPGDFQIDPKGVHINPLVDGAARKAVQEINEMDLNHDGKRDIAQVHAAYTAVVPMLALLNEAVDFEQLAEQFADNPAIKDKAKFAEVLKLAGAFAEHHLPTL